MKMNNTSWTYRTMIVVPGKGQGSRVSANGRGHRQLVKQLLQAGLQLVANSCKNMILGSCSTSLL